MAFFGDAITPCFVNWRSLGVSRHCRSRRRSWVARLPELAGNRQRFDTGVLPPADFVTRLMQIVRVSAAERDRELVADLHADRAGLRKAQVMRV